METARVNMPKRYYEFSAEKDMTHYLSRRFLYDNDAESAQLLLTLCQMEEAIESLFVDYRSIRKMRRDILRYFRERESKELLVANISRMIHEDVSRLELYLYLEGYRGGFSSVSKANRLEILAFQRFSLEELYEETTLFKYEQVDPDILSFKDSVILDLRQDRKMKRFLRSTVTKFYRKVIGPKISNINDYMDIQMVINCKDGELYAGEDDVLNSNEIRGLHQKLLSFLYRDGIRVYRNGFWEGINDHVLKRYQ